VLQARHIRDILGISEAKAYEVLNSRKCPTIRMGKRMVVMKDSFINLLYSSQGDSLMG
jgi:predicted DNA-binding transcriptional regulator AlpA